MSVIFGRLLTSLVLIAVSTYIWIESGEFPANGDQLPRFCAFVAAVILIVMLIKDLLSIDKEKMKFDFSYQANKQFVILFFSILYVGSIFLIGYYVSTALFLVLGCFLVGVRKPRFVMFTVIITLPLMYAFFELFLQAGLPRGLAI